MEPTILTRDPPRVGTTLAFWTAFPLFTNKRGPWHFIVDSSRPCSKHPWRPAYHLRSFGVPKTYWNPFMTILFLTKIRPQRRICTDGSQDICSSYCCTMPAYSDRKYKSLALFSLSFHVFSGCHGAKFKHAQRCNTQSTG